MFVGRESELAALERLYRKDGFQMAVVYGRRRVGKTTLIDEFAKSKPSLFFTAQEKSAVLNLRLFSQAAYAHFDLPASTGAFETWADALSFVAERAKDAPERLVLVFDEFPYAAAAEPSLPSAFQIAIDHAFKGANVCVVLCGSNEGFMESEVLGRKSPLHGRRTAQIKLQPFDCFDAALMLPSCTIEDKVKYYATFGGTPYYLSQIDAELPYEDNVADLFFSKSGLLYEEPLMLLRQELREPALYNSVLDAVGSGATAPKEIAERAGMERNSIGKYLKTLENLGILKRSVPFGENPDRSRKGQYAMRDPFVSYWYRFVSKNVGAVESGAGREAARQTAFGDALSAYVGAQFETVCLQWMTRANRKGRLPFTASAFGRWWGTDPVAREEADIDAIAADKATKRAIFAECKWRNSFNETKAIELLERRSSLVPGYDKRFSYLFSKKPVAEATMEKARQRADLTILTAADLFLDL